MRQWIAVLTLCALVATMLGGCATSTPTGALVGAGTGAAAGAVIGGATRGTSGAVVGAFVGALAGGLVGALVGKYIDQRKGDRAAAVRQAGSVPRDGNAVTLRQTRVVPTAIRRGQTVTVVVDYSVLAPNPDQKVDLNEWKRLQRGDQDVLTPHQRRLRTDQGVYQSRYEFQVPADVPPGQYRVVTVLATEGQMATEQRAEAPLRIE